MRRILAYSAIAGLLCGSVMAQTNSFWNVRVSTNLILGTSTITTSNGTLLVDGSPVTGSSSGITNSASTVSGLTLTTANGIVTLGGSIPASGITNNWTGGVITLDAANSQTNTFGGYLVIGPARYQANSGTASGDGSWANNFGTASGQSSWANYSGTASGSGSWANYSGIASGDGSWANYGGTASGTGSWAMGYGARATNNDTFVWSDGTTISSTSDNQFSAYAANGYRLLGGPITGNGSGLTGVNAATLNGVALAGLVQTNAALDRLRLNDGGGLTNLPVAAAAAATNDLRWLVDSTLPNTTNDLVGFAPHSFLPSQASTTAPIVDGPTLYNAATNNWTMLLALRYRRELTGSNLQWSVLRSGESSTLTSNYTVRVAYTNTLTGAAWSGTLFTNTIGAVNVWTNHTLTDAVLTNLPVGAMPQLIFTVPVSATNGASSPAYWMIRNGGNQW
jgi:hypothetical protein